jgi:hypothetical protein
MFFPLCQDEGHFICPVEKWYASTPVGGWLSFLGIQFVKFFLPSDWPTPGAGFTCSRCPIKYKKNHQNLMTLLFMPPPMRTRIVGGYRQISHSAVQSFFLKMGL